VQLLSGGSFRRLSGVGEVSFFVFAFEPALERVVDGFFVDSADGSAVVVGERRGCKT
jgi:hypothetical protein